LEKIKVSKTVLITGGAGFIAHHIVDRILRTTDWNIVSLDRLDFSGNLNRLAEVVHSYPPEVQKRVKIVYHDLKAEINTLTSDMIGRNINYVLHLAAGSHVDRSIDHPMEFVMDNVVGTGNLLQWARNLPSLERFVNFSTDEVFGPAPPGVSYKEYDRYNSGNPYSASKAGAEELCVAFENTYKMPIVITHTMNVFGERQHPEKYIPLCIQKIRDGETVTIHSDPTRTQAGSRHYIHAKDVADGLMFILEKLQDYKHEGDYGHAKCPKFNLVGPEEIDNLELAQIIARAQGKELKYEMVDFHSSRPGHDLRYALDGALLEGLGWIPQIKLSERVKEVVDWTLANPRWMRK
jgi:dTDP-glucose 4,6-dehydratase